MATSTLNDFRGNLAANITTQLATDTVTGVTVFKFPPGDRAPATDYLFIGRIETEQVRLVYGGPRSETLTAEVAVYVEQAGADDTVSDAVETRALVIAASVENTLRDDPTVDSGTPAVWDAEYAGHQAEPGVTPEGRNTTLTITVTAESHI
jgi:hypothetical protein